MCFCDVSGIKVIMHYLYCRNNATIRDKEIYLITRVSLITRSRIYSCMNIYKTFTICLHMRVDTVI